MNSSASPSAPSNTRLQPRPLTAGTHLARCSAIIDLGTHTEVARSVSGAPATTASSAGGTAKRKVLLTFTLFAQDGSTQRLSRQFTLSCDVRSSLSKFLTPWLGTAWKHPLPGTKLASLKVSGIAEQPCLLVLQSSEATNPRTGQPYLNIASASPLIAGLDVPTLKWPASLFSLKAPNREVFQQLPAWIQAKIRASHEWQTLRSRAPKGVVQPA